MGPHWKAFNGHRRQRWACLERNNDLEETKNMQYHCHNQQNKEKKLHIVAGKNQRDIYDIRPWQWQHNDQLDMHINMILIAMMG